MGQNETRELWDGVESPRDSVIPAPPAANKSKGKDISSLQVSSLESNSFFSRMLKKRGKSPLKTFINPAWIAEIQASDRSEILHQIKPLREKTDTLYYTNINNVNQAINFIEEFYLRKAEVKCALHINGGPLLSLNSNTGEEGLIEEGEEATKAQNLVHEIAVEVFDENQKKIRLSDLAKNPRFRGDMKQGRKEYTKLRDLRNDLTSSFNDSKLTAGFLLSKNVNNDSKMTTTKQKAYLSTALNGSQTLIEQHEIENEENNASLLSSENKNKEMMVDEQEEDKSEEQKNKSNNSNEIINPEEPLESGEQEEEEESELVENSKQQVSGSEEPSVAPDNVDSIFADFENENEQQQQQDEEDLLKKESVASEKEKSMPVPDSIEKSTLHEAENKKLDDNDESFRNSPNEIKSENVSIQVDARKSRVYGFHGGYEQPKLHQSQDSKSEKNRYSFSSFDYNSVQNVKSKSQSEASIANHFNRHFSKKSTLSNTNLSNLEKKEEEEKQKEINRNRKEAQFYYKTLPRGVYGGSKKYSGEILSQSKDSEEVSEKKPSKKEIETIESSINISGYLLNDSQDLYKKEREKKPPQNAYEEKFDSETKKLENNHNYHDFRALLTNFEYETEKAGSKNQKDSISNKGYQNFLSNFGGENKKDNLDERDLNFDNDFFRLERSSSHKLSEVESFTGRSKLKVTSKKLTMRSDVDFPDFL